jgi:hypothetical protein
MLLTFVLASTSLASPIPDLVTQAPYKVGTYGQLISTRYTSKDGLPDGEAKRVGIEGGIVFATMRAEETVTKGDVSRRVPIIVALRSGRWDRVAPAGRGMTWDELERSQWMEGFPGPVTSLARTRAGEIWAVTGNGSMRKKDSRVAILDLPRNLKSNQPVPNVDTVIRQVVGDKSGHIWLATDQGVYITDGADWWHPLNRNDGMPYEDVLCVAHAPNGDVWGGTTEGAWRLRKGEWRYFWGKRWLPGNRVNDIAFTEDGAVWLATDGGVAKIEEKPTTLAQKAKHYEQITATRHSRRGWVTGSNFKVPGDPSGGVVYEASDNDGLWTAVYVAAKAFEYGATKDAAARARARESMTALLDLVRLSGYPGYPGRAIIRKGEVVNGYDPSETVRVEGETDKIWYTSPVDASLLIKGDTSSDELDGHYFAWYVYHELVADESEKRAIRDVVRAVTNNIVDHEYTLVGHTGRKTRWGVFGPQYLNDDPRWEPERGLNSAELLCYLRVANHICGDQKFKDAYEDLIKNHHYLINTLYYRRGATWDTINHSDDQLAYLVYYPLLLLERAPDRRAILEPMIAFTWKGLRDERSPLYNFMFGATTGAECAVEEAVQTLQDWPWELIERTARNSHRHDVTFRTAKGVRRTEIDRVLPASERRLMRWNGNPWSPDGGSDGRSEEDGSAWLLPYWMGRYHKLITE